MTATVRLSLMKSTDAAGAIDVREFPLAVIAERLRKQKARPRKASLPMLSPVEFGQRRNQKGSLRHDGNVVAVHGVVGDIDKGQVTLAEVCSQLRAAGIQALIHTTPSHTAAAPRLRVVAPTSPRAPADHYELTSKLNAACRGILAPESWSLSRTYYYGPVSGVPFEVAVVDGVRIDELESLSELPPVRSPKSESPAADRESDSERDELLTRVTADTLADLDAACAFLDTDDYVAWVAQCGLPLASLKGTQWEDQAHALWHKHSERGAGYDHDQAEEKWQGFDPSRVDYRAIFNEAARRGWVNPKATRPAAADAERLTFVEAAEYMAVDEPDELIEEVLPAKGIAAVYGESGSGKTTLVIDIMGHASRALPWRAKEVSKRCRVFYVVAEGQSGFRKRLRADALKYHGEPIPIYVTADALNLMSGQDCDLLIKRIEDRGGADIVVGDTLAALTPGANENSSEHMGPAIENAKRIQRAFDCLVLLIAHSGKDQSRGLRGWSGVRAALDAELEVTREGDNRKLVVTKMRDGEDGAVYPFRLVPVEVGRTKRGKPITACVVEHIEQPMAIPKARIPKGQNNQLVHRVLTDLLPVEGNTVSVEEAIAESVKRMVRDPDQRDRRRQYARQSITALSVQGFISIEGDVCTVH